MDRTGLEFNLSLQNKNCSHCHLDIMETPDMKARSSCSLFRGCSVQPHNAMDSEHCRSILQTSGSHCISMEEGQNIVQGLDFDEPHSGRSEFVHTSVCFASLFKIAFKQTITCELNHFHVEVFCKFDPNVFSVE